MNPPLNSVLTDARATLDRLRARLMAERGDAAHWTGSLSASALSTATAVSALSIVLRSGSGTDASLRRLIAGGVRYLLDSQNTDGGFGDTDRSYSNIATTMLGIAALRLAGQIPEPGNVSVNDPAVATAIERAQAYVERAGGIPGLRRRYGTDKTFVIPILTNCALAGMVPWREVQPLPFEAAAVPQSLYRRMRMPVVSYAIPALVAIGQARFFHAPPRNPLVAALRGRLVSRTLDVLHRMQPASGGYLEATPLTSFVLMSLASTGRADHPVSKQAVRFLRESVLEDGSWPIDTNLATWVTSLSVHALSCDPEDNRAWASQDLLDWLLACQHTERHPFTGAEPGGWGWTDLSGAVPDGDDTPAAILALAPFLNARTLDAQSRRRIEAAAEAGTGWLLQLQNRDGGWPTFCRGWGRLPFDRSSTDLTAHALRAFRTLREVGMDATESFDESRDLQKREREGEATEYRRGTRRSMREEERAVAQGWRFLKKSQCADGSWLPLWFGNQDNGDDLNPVYGTGRALLALTQKNDPEEVAAATRAADYLVRSQNRDGGWGGGVSLTRWLHSGQAVPPSGIARKSGIPSETGPAGESGCVCVTSSIEETSVALEGLASFVLSYGTLHRAGGRGGDTGSAGSVFSGSPGVRSDGGGVSVYRSAIIRAVIFLCQAVREDRHHNPWPIGFYFAKLWYHERLYPTIFATAALGIAIRVLRQSPAKLLRDAERV